MFRELKGWFQQLVAAKKTEADEVDFILEQAKFLLENAAMVSAPDDAARLAGSITPFGYMNPLTLASMRNLALIMEHGDVFSTIGISPTKWILTTLMPEGTIIMTPNVLPGLQPLVDAQVLRERARA